MSDIQLADVGYPPERRRSLRFACEFGIAIEWGAAQLHGTVKDISEAGMLVQLDGPLWLGASFSAQMEIDGAPVVMDCVVCRIVPRLGMAVSYRVTQSAGRTAISALLERLGAR